MKTHDPMKVQPLPVRACIARIILPVNEGTMRSIASVQQQTWTNNVENQMNERPC